MSKKIIVLGLGVSGKAAARFLLSKGEEVIGIDQKEPSLRSDPEIVSLLSRGMTLFQEIDSLEGISQVVSSPGILPTHPLLKRAQEANIEVIGEVELACRFLKNRCIGITGSNGKTTATLLTVHFLNRAGKKARALGNVGVGLSSYLLNPDPEEILVIELSSFQLEKLQSKVLDLAVILNITPNHLDRHPDMDAYVAAKMSIQDRLKQGGSFWVSRQVANAYPQWILKDFSVFEETENLAFKIAKQFSEPRLEDAFSFQKPPHRIEWVADIDGVSYYNDSKSSNVHSVMYAVKALSGPIVLIVGGVDKGSSYRPWIECFRGKVKRIIAYGAAADKIASELSSDFPLEKKGPFREAVLAAQRGAQKHDTILLSPGCSSYDQFQSYEYRGDAFKRIVEEFR